MFIRIESTSGVPITRQIVDQIRTKCATGELLPGSRLPSVRELARDLAVNQNTILRVYERLTVEGLLERRHGSGTFVTEDVAPGQLESQKEMLRDDLNRLVLRAKVLGLSAEDLTQLIGESFEKTPQAEAGEGDHD
jgi:DNA-binding transcriptional regulator YhcF (GntR family)